MRVIVLNDSHPNEFPGASTVAFFSHSQIIREFNSIFLCGSTNLASHENTNAYFKVGKPGSFLKLLRRFSFCRELSKYIKFRSTIWTILRVYKFKPEVIIIHKIGDVFSFSLLPIFKMMKIKLLYLHHDYSALKSSKLYPNDFQISDYNIDDFCINKRYELFSKFRIKFSRKILRKLLNSCTKQYAQTNFQSNFLEYHGFRIEGIIPQTLESRSDIKSKIRLKRSSDFFQILFAGRVIGKGFEKLVDFINLNNEFKLVLAGTEELHQEAMKKLPLHSFNYLGLLNQEDLRQVIKEVDLVFACSKCFDVGPRIALEALYMGTPAICSSVVGHADWLMKLDKRLLVEYDKPLEAGKLVEIIANTNVIVDKFNKTFDFESKWTSLVHSYLKN